MPYTLKQAADATGKSKSTIFRSIKNHVISASKDHNGEWLIDPSELHRVFSPVSGDTPHKTLLERCETPNETTVLRREVEFLDQQLASERDERTRERETLQGTIGDLRRRLDQEGEERRKVQTQLTALLTDQRAQTEKVAPISPPPVAQARDGVGWGMVAMVLAVICGVAVVVWWLQTHPLPSVS